MAGMAVRGTVSVVTGASSGIGWATAVAFARRGSTVVAAARRKDRLDELVAGIEARGGSAVAVPCDVAERSQVSALAERVLGEFGRCDVLVNNAGISQRGPFADIALDQIERVVRVNYLGVLYGTKAFLPAMLDAGRGHVVNVASLAGRFATPGSGVYSSTKHAVVAFSESLHYELHGTGILVTAVNPGFVETEGFPHRGAERRLGVMQPERIAELIAKVVETGKAPEVSMPRWLASLQVARLVTPQLYRLALRNSVRGRSGSNAGRG